MSSARLCNLVLLAEEHIMITNEKQNEKKKWNESVTHTVPFVLQMFSRGVLLFFQVARLAVFTWQMIKLAYKIPQVYIEAGTRSISRDHPEHTSNQFNGWKLGFEIFFLAQTQSIL